LAQAAKAVDAGRLKTQLERLTQRDVRLLESVAPTDESETRYRLPHERLLPALHRVAGQLLAEVDQTRLKFENAFTAWKNSNQDAQYLLKAGDLRAVERYQSQIPWGKDAPEKRAFLRRSQRRRTIVRLVIIATVLCLLAIGWLANSSINIK
jgi:predicted ABC-type exoprotein transport system permease subunit